MTYETILVDRDGPVATIRLHRPERMNAVIEAMYREIAQALAALESELDNRVVVVTGSVRVKDGIERPAFCAGADLKEHASGRRSRAERRAYIELAHGTLRRILTFPRPVVAAVNGPARGAGAELALACDFVLMADEATLALPEVGLGTFVGGGLTHLLPRLVGLARARELVYTGRVVDGREAAALGLAVRSVPGDRLADEARSLATALAAQAPRSMALAKRLLLRADDDVETALVLETDAIVGCMETEDWAEGLRAFAEKRAPRYSGR